MQREIEAAEAVAARIGNADRGPVQALIHAAKVTLEHQGIAAARLEAERARRRAKIVRLETRVAELEAKYEPSAAEADGAR
jgi:Skp family chaperone for outer membrane proteins